MRGASKILCPSPYPGSKGLFGLPSGKRLHSYGKSLFLMGKLTISMAIFNSYVGLPEGNLWFFFGGVHEKRSSFLTAKPPAPG